MTIDTTATPIGPEPPAQWLHDSGLCVDYARGYLVDDSVAIAEHGAALTYLSRLAELRKYVATLEAKLEKSWTPSAFVAATAARRTLADFNADRSALTNLDAGVATRRERVAGTLRGLIGPADLDKVPSWAQDAFDSAIVEDPRYQAAVDARRLAAAQVSMAETRAAAEKRQRELVLGRAN